MAARRKGAEAAPKVEALDKIACLLAMIVTKEMKQDDAAILLDNIGFTGAEITKLLGVNDNYVRVARFRAKNGKKKRAKG
jgi:hypothetical protein